MAHRTICLTLLTLTLASCTEPRVKTYSDMLDPLIGSADKGKLSSVLGAPTKCEVDRGSERCEFRTRAGRNAQTPSVHQPQPGFGPDVSPYEFFDVIQVQFNDVGRMKGWEAVVIGGGLK